MKKPLIFTSEGYTYKIDGHVLVMREGGVKNEGQKLICLLFVAMFGIELLDWHFYLRLREGKVELDGFKGVFLFLALVHLYF